MTNEDLYKDRYRIIFDALAVGIRIEYKLGWFLFYEGGELFQSYYKDDLNKHIVHRSGILVADLMKFVDTMSVDLLKRLYGDIRLFRLQNKLLGE
jgi:hypothetical protein